MGHAYSARRFRIVVVLLTILSIPLVIGGSLLVYHYVKFSVMVDKRLKGERWMMPSRIYARPLVLHEGMMLAQPELLKILNGLKYEQKTGALAQAGEFSIGENVVTLLPRPGADVAIEPVAIVFDKGRVKEMRGLRSKKRYPSQTLEPELITYLFDESREKRRIVRYEELPDHLVKAVLAIEDRRFFTHPGLDPLRIIGAALRNLRAESYLQGGSTITQQLVKNFFLTPERTIRRKVQEAFLAFVLERRASKQEILELYLNEIYLGQAGSFSINGMGEAARMYFRKDVANLTLPEAALAGGHDPVAQSLQPLSPQGARHRAPQHGAARDARGGLHRGGHGGSGHGAAAARRAARARQRRGALLRRPGRQRSSRSATKRRICRPRTSRSIPRSTCTCKASPRARSRTVWVPSTS